MTSKEHTELAREFVKVMKRANISRTEKENIYNGFLAGLEKSPNYSDKNIMQFCNVLDDVVKVRRGIK